MMVKYVVKYVRKFVVKYVRKFVVKYVIKYDGQVRSKVCSKGS
jgi:hypothetical protein